MPLVVPYALALAVLAQRVVLYRPHTVTQLQQQTQHGSAGYSAPSTMLPWLQQQLTLGRGCTKPQPQLPSAAAGLQQGTLLPLRRNPPETVLSANRIHLYYI